MKMNQYDFTTFNLYVTPNGIFLWSKLSTDFPFFIMDSPTMGFKVFLSDEMQSINYYFQEKSLDLTSTVLVTTLVPPDDPMRWVISIPFIGCTVALEEYFPKSIFHQHYLFSAKDFPPDYRDYASLAFSVGHPE